MFMVAPRGSAKLHILGETPRFFSVHSIVTGRVAELDPELTQVTLLGENFKHFRGKIIDVGLWISFEVCEPDVVKTYFLARP